MQEIFRFQAERKFEIKDFFDDESNEDAIKWVMAWPNWPKKQLNIYSEHSCGKTHLGSLWAEYTGAHYITNDESISARELLFQNKNFIIDPVEKVMQHDYWLFDFLNICVENNASVLLISSVADFSKYTSLKDLSSRLNAIPHVKINQPSDSLLRKIIFSTSQSLGVTLNDNVVDYMIKHFDRDIKSITDTMKRANDLSLIQKKAIDIKILKSICN